MPVLLGIALGLLAVLVVCARRIFGATNRGLVVLITSAVLAVTGLIAKVEEYELIAIALFVLLITGPFILWRRTDHALGTIQLDLRPSSHELSVNSPAHLSIIVKNSGPNNCAPIRLESPDGMWHLSRPGFRLRRSENNAQQLSKLSHSPSWSRQFANSLKIPALSAGESTELDFIIPNHKRGVLTLSSLRLWCIDPFELFAYEMVLPLDTSILVVPNATPPPSAIQGILQPAGRIEWSPPASGEATGGQGFDLSGLRAYVPGDRLRLLHWPTLARTGELLVRNFEGSGTDAVTLIMDDRAEVLDQSGFEAIVSAAAGIGLETARLNLGLELRTPGGINLDIQAGSALSKSILRVLATLDPIPSRSPKSITITQNQNGQSDNHRILISTPKALETLPEILRRSSTLVLV